VDVIATFRNWSPEFGVLRVAVWRRSLQTVSSNENESSGNEAEYFL
jgi:hypothetical protein